MSCANRFSFSPSSNVVRPAVIYLSFFSPRPSIRPLKKKAVPSILCFICAKIRLCCRLSKSNTASHQHHGRTKSNTDRLFPFRNGRLSVDIIAAVQLLSLQFPPIVIDLRLICLLNIGNCLGRVAWRGEGGTGE